MKQVKHFFKVALLGASLFIGTNAAFAQRMVEVPSLSNLSDAIFGDTTATGERVDDNTVYVLERNGFYPVSRSLQLSVPLQIKTKEGDGARAYIYPKPNTSGSYPLLIKNNSDIMLTSVHITNQNGPGNQPKWGGFRAQGENSKVVLEDCFVEWDKASAVQIRANGVSVKMTKCRFAKCGNYKQINGNGRIIDAREFDLDQVEIRNCTFYHLADRIIRNMQGGTINSFIFDHNTGAHIQGFHGTFHMGRVKYCQITNNLIINPKYMGNHPNVSEQTGPAPDNTQHYLVTADTILAETMFKIHHNNFAYTKDVLDMFAANDTVSKPEILAPIVATAMGEAAKNVAIEEVVDFTSMPSLPKDFMYAIFAQPTPDPIPDNFPDNIGIAAIDATYPTSSASHSAAEGGHPLGDLTWWGIDLGINSTNINNSIVSLYPNPVSNTLNIKVDLETSSNINFRVLDLTGKAVKTGLIAGSGNINTIDVSNLKSGLYIYTIENTAGSISGKFTVK